MSEIRSKLEAIRAAEGNNAGKEDGGVWGGGVRGFKRGIREDLDEKVTRKSGPGKEE